MVLSRVRWANYEHPGRDLGKPTMDALSLVTWARSGHFALSAGQPEGRLASSEGFRIPFSRFSTMLRSLLVICLWARHLCRPNSPTLRATELDWLRLAERLFELNAFERIPLFGTFTCYRNR